MKIKINLIERFRICRQGVRFKPANLRQIEGVDAFFDFRLGAIEFTIADLLLVETLDVRRKAVGGFHKLQGGDDHGIVAVGHEPRPVFARQVMGQHGQQDAARVALDVFVRRLHGEIVIFQGFRHVARDDLGGVVVEGQRRDKRRIGTQAPVGKMASAHERERMGDDRHVVRVLLDVLNFRIAHEPPSVDVAHAMQHGEKRRHDGLLPFVNRAVLAIRVRIGHAGDVVHDDARGRRVRFRVARPIRPKGLGGPRRVRDVLLAGKLPIILKQAFDLIFYLHLVAFDARGRVDAIDVDLDQRFEGLPLFGAHGDVVVIQALFDDVAHERVDDLGVASPERPLQRFRQLSERQKSAPRRVFDVATDIGDAIREANDAPLERCGRRVMKGARHEACLIFVSIRHKLEFIVFFTAVRRNAVAHFERQIQTGASLVLRQDVDDAQPVLFVTKLERRIVALQETIQRRFAGMAVRGVPNVVSQGDRTDQVRIQTQRAPDRLGKVAHVQDVLHARADVIVLRIEKDLRLVTQSAKRHGI
jgi:hypothetical protein